MCKFDKIKIKFKKRKVCTFLFLAIETMMSYSRNIYKIVTKTVLASILPLEAWAQGLIDLFCF
jgi:hypothetical protein